MNYDFDLFVIGAGSGGVRASRIAAQLGAKVAVAENLYLGGTCVNVGCVPKKLFVYASEYSQAFKSSEGFGWSGLEPKFNWQTLRDNKTREIQRLNGVYNNILEGADVTVVYGHAKIIAPNEVSVDGKTYTAEKILIATGGWPSKPGYPGGEYAINSNEVFYLDELPKKVIVQGGGYIAVEFAGIFNGLGCETELIYRGPLFLRGFDEEVRVFVKEEIEKSGIKISFNSDINGIQKQPDGRLSVSLNDGSTRKVDAVFAALGRRPKTEGLGLENTEVKLGKKGEILVDQNFKTHQANIYAIGDVVGRKELTPVALAEGMALAHHLFNGKAITLDYQNIATAVFCQPNIATIGYSQEAAVLAGLDVSIFKSNFKAMKNTLSGSNQRTFMKLIVDKSSDKVVGVHMVGPDAGEILQGIAIAIKAGATKADFDSTIGIHPTAAEEFATMRTPAN
ncbi:MAG: glutathione reductase (NADPH) [Lentisphaeria bacterium]|jgi:glutathione reductase (NADPH)